MASDTLEYGTDAFRRGVDRLLKSYREIPDGVPIRLAKKTSNLFRKRADSSAPGLDVSGLDRVISVDPAARTAQVAGMCTYEDLVAATLPYGLAPKVVPQLKTITLGGAVTGLGIESTSFRNGLPHESVRELEILTPTGDLVIARPDNENADLFFGFPNSYGTLGYSVRLEIDLEQVHPFVALRHVRFTSIEDLQTEMIRIANDGAYDDERVDYLDGVVFTRDECYLTLGRQTSEPGPVSDYTGMDIYYRSIQHGPSTELGEQTTELGEQTTEPGEQATGLAEQPRFGGQYAPKRDRLTIADYLWRWDTDWFWCSRAFGAQNRRIRRLWPKKYLRSSFYWKLIGYDHKWNIGDKLNARKGQPPSERVVQDIEVPIERTADFINWFLDEIPIEPIWLCPLKLGFDPSTSSGSRVSDSGSRASDSGSRASDSGSRVSDSGSRVDSAGSRASDSGSRVGSAGSRVGSAGSRVGSAGSRVGSAGSGVGDSGSESSGGRSLPSVSSPEQPWPLYPLKPGRFYTNVGFWSGVPVTPGHPGHANRRIENKVTELGGHKSLYSESFYPEDEFNELYGSTAYRALRAKYDPHGRLSNLYEKAVKRA